MRGDGRRIEKSIGKVGEGPRVYHAVIRQEKEKSNHAHKAKKKLENNSGFLSSVYDVINSP